MGNRTITESEKYDLRIKDHLNNLEGPLQRGKKSMLAAVSLHKWKHSSYLSHLPQNNEQNHFIAVDLLFRRPAAIDESFMKDLSASTRKYLLKTFKMQE